MIQLSSYRSLIKVSLKHLNLQIHKSFLHLLFFPCNLFAQKPESFVLKSFLVYEFCGPKKKRKELGTSRRISPSAESESPTRSQKQEQIPWTAPPFLRRSIQVKGACSGACLCLQRVDVKKDLRFCVWTTG